MEQFSHEEKLQIIKWCYSGQSYRKIRDLISVMWSHRQIPSKTTIESFIKKFEKTGTFNFNKQEINNVSYNNEENVLALIEANPTLSLREIATEVGISHVTVYNILKKYKYYPYKFHCHQELLPQDFENRASFCEIIMEKANESRDFIKNICFTDECTFTLNKKPNLHNSRYWSQHNPHYILETNSQYIERVNVWAGILGSHIIGPFFIEKINSDKYLELLIEKVGPEIANLNLETVWFQHDGCPAHNAYGVREYLNDTFPNSWIGRGGTINWPARSPDLTPCDFFLWGHLKNVVNRKRYENIEQLKAVISNECRKINARQLHNVRHGFYNRLGYCLAQNGGLFEHLI